MTTWGKVGVASGVVGAVIGLGLVPWASKEHVRSAASTVEAKLEAHEAEERTERRTDNARLEHGIDEVRRDVKSILELMVRGRR